MHLFCVLRIKYKLHCLISKEMWVTVWMFVVLMELCCIVWWFMAVTGRHLLLQSSLSLGVSLCSHQRPMRDGNFLWVSLNDPPSHLPPSLSRLFPFSLSNHPPRSLAFWIFGLCSVPVTLSLSLSFNPPFLSKNNSSFLYKALASNSFKYIHYIHLKNISDDLSIYLNFIKHACMCIHITVYIISINTLIYIYI